MSSQLRRVCWLLALLLLDKAGSFGMWRSRLVSTIRSQRRCVLSWNSQAFSLLSNTARPSRRIPVAAGKIITKCLASAVPAVEFPSISESDWKEEEESPEKRSTDPLEWTRPFGSRSAAKWERYRTIANLKAQDEGFYHVQDLQIPSVTIVTTLKQARIVVERLMAAPPDMFHACDTEVMDLDLKNAGPVGNGYVTCLSVYSGPQFDYGLGQSPGSTLWIDNLDSSFGLLEIFKPWLESTEHKKVWHNYGFDRHVLWNEGINVQGLGGDTIHMARLQDTSRLKTTSSKANPYSLEGLTDELLGRRKKSMKELFGVPRTRKDGSQGSVLDLPPVEVLQRDPQFRKLWIRYSAYDAEGTWLLREKLQSMLQNMDWYQGCNLYDYYQLYLCPFAELLTDMERRGIRVNAGDYLAKVELQARADRDRHMATFRNWAADFLGADGLAMNPASSVQLQTFLFGGFVHPETKVSIERERVFTVSRDEIPPEALDAYENRAKPIVQEPPTDELTHMTAVQLKALCKARGLKVSGKKQELQDRLRGFLLNEDIMMQDLDEMTDEELRQTCIATGLSDKLTRAQAIKQLKRDRDYQCELLGQVDLNSDDGVNRLSNALLKAKEHDPALAQALEISASSKVSKNIDVTITSLGMTPTVFTAGGTPSVTANVLRSLAGDPFHDPPKYGSAYQFFGGGKKGHDACVGLYSLTAIGSIDTMITNFLSSLQSRVDDYSRVHCSLNFNTETGRLSSRGPNLQNQPALEKDTYKIRKAFEALPGNRLIVADYGQLELRLLASMTNCKSMIEAFEKGGDFHSRTAMGMFDYIQRQVDAGQILFEWDYSQGDPPKPLLKDVYASERRKAKTLNFSIAYGKTAHGLSQDWGVSMDEASAMLEAWYNSRPEVLNWQQQTKLTANKLGITRTLQGRYRQIPDAKLSNRRLRSAAERASINTPIQGGAADVAMMAMLKINQSPKLASLGWILLLQIHDEVILEGPAETAQEAFDEVITCMQNPWCFGLEPTKVPLLVDGSYIHTNWYDAK